MSCHLYLLAARQATCFKMREQKYGMFSLFVTVFRHMRYDELKGFNHFSENQSHVNPRKFGTFEV